MSRPWTFAVAAIVGALTIAAYLFRTPQQPQAVSDAVPNSSAATQTPAAAMSAQTVRVDLDLRNTSSTTSKSKSVDSLVLPRRRLHASIVLPSGFTTAQCDLEIRGADGQARAATSGLAAFQEGVAVLRTTLDLAVLSPGVYHLAVRQDGREWHSIQVHLK
jgi:hypothetical protein